MTSTPGFNIQWASVMACDGSTDDTSALSGLLTKLGSSTLVRLEIPSGSCVLSNLTINANIMLDFTPGAAFKVASGQSVSILGTVDSPGQAIFTGSGAVSFVSNVKMFDFNPMWWGVDCGDNSNDDQPALTSMVAAVPDYRSFRFPAQCTLNIASTWTITSRNGLRFYTDGGIILGGQGSAQTKIKQLPAFTSGSTMIFIQECGGFQFGPGFEIIAMASTDTGNPGEPNVGIDIDGFGSNTSTEDWIIGNVIWNRSANNASWIAIRLSHTATQNNDLMHFVGNRLVGSGVFRSRPDFSITSGTNTLTTVSSGGFNSGDVGARVRIGGAGAAGGVLDTTISAFTSGSQVTLAANASTTVSTTGYGIIGQGYGSGISIESSESHTIEIYNDTITGFLAAVNVIGGFAHFHHNNIGGNEIDYEIGSGCAGSTIIDEGDSENSLQGIVASCGNGALKVMGMRFANANTIPGGAYIKVNNSAGPLSIENSEFDLDPPATTTIYDFSGASSRNVTLMNNRYPTDITSAQLNYSSAPAGMPLTLINERGNSSVYPRGMYLLNQPVAYGTHTLDGTTTPDVSSGANFQASGSPTITNFLNGVDGQQIYVSCNSTNTVFANGSTIKVKGGSNFSCSGGTNLLEFVNQAGVWYEIGH